jgi:hypothetical protein
LDLNKKVPGQNKPAIRATKTTGDIAADYIPLK